MQKCKTTNWFGIKGCKQLREVSNPVLKHLDSLEYRTIQENHTKQRFSIYAVIWMISNWSLHSTVTVTTVWQHAYFEQEITLDRANNKTKLYVWEIAS